MYKNIVFDLYGTLVDIHTDEEKDSVWETMSWFYRLHQVKSTPRKLKRDYHRLIEKLEKENKKILGKDSHPEIDLTVVFQKIFEENGVLCDCQLAEETTCFFRALTMERLRLYKGIPDLLESLRNAGKKIYLLTNAQKVFTELEIRTLGLEKYFDGIVYSSKEGVKKPDKRFYDILIERYHLNREETIMIGNDALCDVCGALDSGLSAIYLKSSIRGNGKCPDSVLQVKVSDLKNLKKILITKG